MSEEDGKAVWSEWPGDVEGIFKVHTKVLQGTLN